MYYKVIFCFCFVCVKFFIDIFWFVVVVFFRVGHFNLLLLLKRNLGGWGGVLQQEMGNVSIILKIPVVNRPVGNAVNF